MITINLPAETIKSIVNINNPQLEMPINNAYNLLSKESAEPIKSMWANPKLYGSYIEWNYYDLYINKITKSICKNAIPDPNSTWHNRVPLKYWRLHLGYYNSKDETYIIPGFIRFFSKTTKSFVPIEFLKKTDLLVDYKGESIKMTKKEELIDYNIEGHEYYSLLVSTDAQLQETEYESQIYINGILAAIPYYNFENCF